jgi:hypothetical protein
MAAPQPTGQQQQIGDLINKLATIGNQGDAISGEAESLGATAVRINQLLTQVGDALTNLIGMCRDHATRGGQVAGLLAQLQAADQRQQALITAITQHNGTATNTMAEAGQTAEGLLRAIQQAQQDLGAGVPPPQGGGRKHRTKRGGFVYGKAKRMSRRGKRLSKRKQRGGFVYGKAKRMSRRGKRVSRKGKKGGNA